MTVLGGGVLCCELARRRALVTRISAGVSSHREVGKFSPESGTQDISDSNTVIDGTLSVRLW